MNMLPNFDHTRMARHRWRNRFQAVALLSAIALVLILTAQFIAGQDGIVVSVITVALGMVFMPQLAPKAVMKLFRVTPVHWGEAPDMTATVRRLSISAGLPQPPRLFWIPSDHALAFSVGTEDNSLIAIAHGTWRLLSPRELTGVLAHEITHIASGDSTILTLSEMMGRLTRALSMFGLIVALMLALAGQAVVPLITLFLLATAPIGVSLLQLALSRNREFDADLGAAELTGDPRGLASALRKIELEEASLWRRVLMPYHRAKPPKLLRTHPRTEDRISRLLADKPDRKA